MTSNTVIIADGTFPSTRIPLEYLKNAGKIICCDGAAESLLKAGYIPDAIVGDLDSLNPETADLYADRLFADQDQETNDLTKAVKWCRENDLTDIVILGATGKREDHTLGNISLLTEYIKFVKVKMITDTGIFIPYNESFEADTFPGQQISIFSINSETKVNSQGLKYPLSEKKINNWWEATLNEATGNKILIDFKVGPLILFFKFPD